MADEALINLELLYLHSPIMIAGTNLGIKLDPTLREGLSMKYDRANQEVLITFGGKTGIMPVSGALMMVPGDPALKGVVKPPEQFTTAPRQGAQVDSPMGHVFKGPGHGKTGK